MKLSILTLLPFIHASPILKGVADTSGYFSSQDCRVDPGVYPDPQCGACGLFTHSKDSLALGESFFGALVDDRSHMKHLATAIRNERVEYKEKNAEFLKKWEAAEKETDQRQQHQIREERAIGVFDKIFDKLEGAHKNAEGETVKYQDIMGHFLSDSEELFVFVKTLRDTVVQDVSTDAITLIATDNTTLQSHLLASEAELAKAAVDTTAMNARFVIAKRGLDGLISFLADELKQTEEDKDKGDVEDGWRRLRSAKVKTLERIRSIENLQSSHAKWLGGAAIINGSYVTNVGGGIVTECNPDEPDDDGMGIVEDYDCALEHAKLVLLWARLSLELEINANNYNLDLSQEHMAHVEASIAHIKNDIAEYAAYFKAFHFKNSDGESQAFKFVDNYAELLPEITWVDSKGVERTSPSLMDLGNLGPSFVPTNQIIDAIDHSANHYTESTTTNHTLPPTTLPPTSRRLASSCGADGTGQCSHGNDCVGNIIADSGAACTDDVCCELTRGGDINNGLVGVKAKITALLNKFNASRYTLIAENTATEAEIVKLKAEMALIARKRKWAAVNFEHFIQCTGEGISFTATPEEVVKYGWKNHTACEADCSAYYGKSLMSRMCGYSKRWQEREAGSLQVIDCPAFGEPQREQLGGCQYTSFTSPVVITEANVCGDIDNTHAEIGNHMAQSDTVEWAVVSDSVTVGRRSLATRGKDGICKVQQIPCAIDSKFRYKGDLVNNVDDYHNATSDYYVQECNNDKYNKITTEEFVNAMCQRDFLHLTFQGIEDCTDICG